MECQICLNAKRPLKFVTNRIRVCQWCITHLTENYVEPQKLYADIKARIRADKEARLIHGDLSENRKPIAPPQPDSDATLKICESMVKDKEGLLIKAYRSLIDDGARRKEIDSIYTIKWAEEQVKFSQALQTYQRLNSIFESERSAYRARLPNEIEGSYKSYLSSLFHKGGNNPKQEWIIRAHQYGMLTLDGSFEERQEEEHMRPVRRRVILEDEHRCVRCRRSYVETELHVHHIVPLAKHGTNNPVNLVTLCYRCHNQQHKEFQVSRNLPIKRRGSKQTIIKH